MSSNLRRRLTSLFGRPSEHAMADGDESRHTDEPDPEWDELLSWAQVTPASGALQLAAEPEAQAEPEAEAEPQSQPQPLPPPPAAEDVWAQALARVKALERKLTPREIPLQGRRPAPVKAPLWASPVAARLERLVATKERIDQQEAAAAAAAAEEQEWLEVISRAKTGSA